MLREVNVPISENAFVQGEMCIPEKARGLVIFAHGSGSSRHSPRNQYVARVLQEAKLATLLMDLLTVPESMSRKNVFNIELLASRVEAVIDWTMKQEKLSYLPIGLFGASTGAAAALICAAKKADVCRAVVSRGGRADLAAPFLSRVNAPTLLIVGGEDELVLELNKQALAQMRCERNLEVLPGATHLFEEPGALEKVAQYSRDWFLTYFSHSLRHYTPKTMRLGQ